MGHEIWTINLQIGDGLDTRGVYYAPYNKIKCVWKSENAIIAHISGHQQFWGQTAHYINAHFIVFRKIGESDRGNWIVVNDWERETGRQFRKVKTDAIAHAETIKGNAQ